MKLSHETIWLAIDRLAENNRLTPSGLARRAGLDPTSFNKSKRMSTDGRSRWPSTESIAKILDATGWSVERFMQLLDPKKEVLKEQADKSKVLEEKSFLPLLPWSKAEQSAVFDSQAMVVPDRWEWMDAPPYFAAKMPIFALELDDDRYMPLYRSGDRVLIDPQAELRLNDKVLVKTENALSLYILLRQNAKSLELRGLKDGETHHLHSEQVAWMARIVWASQ